MLLGCRVVGSRVCVVSSVDGGVTWLDRGVVSEAKAGEIYGDATLLYCTPTLLLCAFRIEGSLQQNGFAWQVVVCQSADGGKTWTFDSVVDTSQGPFIGAPCLLLRRAASELHVYYDNEKAAKDAGYSGYQWLSLRRKPLGSGRAWAPPTSVLDAPTREAVAKGEHLGLLRDGMASVVACTTSTGTSSPSSDALLVVSEGVDPASPHRNRIYAHVSHDGGLSWTARMIVYEGKAAPDGSRYNAYCPNAVVRTADGTVAVALCTDEDFAPPPDQSSTPPAERRAGVKLTCSMGTLEEWSVGERVVDPSQPAPEPRAYCPGLVEVPGGRMLCTVDRLDGTAQLLVRVS